MEELEGKMRNGIGNKKFDAKFKLRIFISSICNDKGKYDEIRSSLKKEIESTGLAKVYLFEDGPKTISAQNDYIWNVEYSDLCIFIIDNKDGVPQGVQNEINAANRNNIKSLYYFSNQYSDEKTQLQIDLTGPGKPKYQEVSSFDEILNHGTQNLIDEIVNIYRSYCKGRLVEYNGEEFLSVSGVNIIEINKKEEKFLPKVSLKNIDKSCDYIILKTINENNKRDLLGEEIKTSVLDDCALNFLKVLMGEKTIDDFPVDTFFNELKEIQDTTYFSVVKVRWEAILSYFNGNMDSCIDKLEESYNVAKEKDASTWVVQDILIDIRNIKNLKGNIENYYDLKTQSILDEIDEQFHYPILDRIDKTIEEKYIKGFYKKKIDSPHTIYIGGNFTEFGELFASLVLVSMYNGSLTHIRLCVDKLKEYMFYLAEKYEDWIIRKNLLKYALVSAEEKEIVQITEAYPEILNNLCSEEAEEIIRFCEKQPIAFEKLKSTIKAFGTVGYYLSDEVFEQYEKEILTQIVDILKKDNPPNAIGPLLFKNLKKIVMRLNQEQVIEICLVVIRKSYSSWYMDMFSLIDRMDLLSVSEELRIRLILSFESLLYEENGADYLLRNVLIHIRNSDRKNTERLDSIIQEKYPHYYNDSYIIYTCNGDKNVYLRYIDELADSIKKRNLTQGKNGHYSGYVRRDYASLRVVINNFVIPDDKKLKELIKLSIITICESKESVETKIDAIDFLILILLKRKDFWDCYYSDIENMYKRRAKLAGDRNWLFTNVKSDALEFGIILLYSVLSPEDTYYEMMRIIANVQDDLATKISIVRILKKFYEQKDAQLSLQIEAALLSNVLQWLMDDNLDVRRNACHILFGLSQRMLDSSIVARSINELMQNDGVYIKSAILNNLDKVNIDMKTKSEIIRRAGMDHCYLVRKKASERCYSESREDV